jgi:hypothetical protein
MRCAARQRGDCRPGEAASLEERPRLHRDLMRWSVVSPTQRWRGVGRCRHIRVPHTSETVLLRIEARSKSFRTGASSVTLPMANVRVGPT